MVSTYVQRLRRKNYTVGGMLLTTGILMCGLGAFSILQNVNNAAPPKSFFSSEIQQRCEAELQAAGLDTYPGNTAGTIVARGDSLSDAYQRMANISIGIKACLGYSVKNFCIGDACERGPISMTMTSALES